MFNIHTMRIKPVESIIKNDEQAITKSAINNMTNGGPVL